MTNAAGKQTYDIFISYRTTHADWVETLARNLKAQDYTIFLDRWELIPGQHFPGAIAQALKNSRCAILVASPDASDSGWVQQELQLMINLQNSGSDFFYVPIVMGEFPDMPFLETVQAVDFGDSSPRNSIVAPFNGCSVACNGNRPVQTRCSKASCTCPKSIPEPDVRWYKASIPSWTRCLLGLRSGVHS
jgi:hypothetical protein